jgi:hypothetical protein
MAWSLSRSAGGSVGMLVSLGLMALALLVVSLVTGWAGGIGWSLVLLGSEYLLPDFFRGGSLEVWVPMVAVGFLLIAELAWWSWELGLPSLDEPTIYLRRAVLTLGVGLISVVLGAVVLAAGSLVTVAGLSMRAVGTAAMVALLTVVAVLALRGSNALATIRGRRPPASLGKRHVRRPD